MNGCVCSCLLSFFRNISLLRSKNILLPQFSLCSNWGPHRKELKMGSNERKRMNFLICISLKKIENNVLFFYRFYRNYFFCIPFDTFYYVTLVEHSGRADWNYFF